MHTTSRTADPAPRGSAGAGDLPPGQRAIRGQCAHPTGAFVAFTKAEIDQSIPARFEQQVGKHGARQAVRTRNHSLTYDELNGAANRIAQSILERGGPAGRPIALLLDNDAPMVAAMLGVLKAGGMYVPLDPNLPPARLAFILRDSEATLVITSRRQREALPTLFEDGLPWFDVDALITGGDDAGNAGIVVPPDALTWIIYTSGSTGQPKGTVQTHRNVLHYVHNYTNGLRISCEDRFVLLFPFGVNAAAHEIYSALLNGACLYPFDVKSEGPTRLAGWMLEHRVTMYSSVPTVFRHFSEALHGTQRFPHLRVVKLLGEPVAPKDVRSFQTHFASDCILVNRLGSTETGGIRWNFIDTSTAVDERYVPVGFAVEDNEIILVDETGAAVPDGEAGEIIVSSPYLSPGYWRNAEATAKAFGPDPRGAPWRRYRTGDLGRMQADGSLVHLGRKDSQVKILGHRVELGEIEAALSALPGIKGAVVAVRRDPKGEPRLVAYVIRTGDEVSAPRTLREALSRRLPGHMVPPVFVELDRFPAAQNGKVNRGALPEPDWRRPQLDVPFVGPRTPLEEGLAALWASALGVERVGIDDNFFDLGGQSLLALRLLSQIERRFGKRLALTALLEAPTVAGLAKHLTGEAHTTTSWSSLAALQPGGSKPPFFWVHGQRSNAFLGRYLGPERPLYGLLQQSRDGTRPRYTRLEDIAAYYLSEMRRAQPEGPYFLGGFCVGATMAFEMAHQLLSAGSDVSLLVLLDPPSPDGLVRRPLTDARRRVRSLWRFPPRELPANVWRGTIRRAKGALATTADAGKRTAAWVYQVAPLEVPIPVALRAHYINAVHTRARRRYSARPYPGKIVVITTKDRRDRRLGWSRLAGSGLEVHELDTWHDDVVFDESSIEGLAKVLSACLDSPERNLPAVSR